MERNIKKRPPTVKFGDKNLKHTEELKILGVVFDRNLSFIQHANYLKSKIYQNTTTLATFSGIKWGIKPRQFRDIYIKSIERTIVYAAAVYWKLNNNSHLLRKMTSVQRIPLIKIVKAYRTVSNKSLNILANIKPIELTLEKEVATFNIFQNKKDYTIGGKQYKKKNKTQHLIEVWKTHPAKLEGFPFRNNNETAIPTEYKIYTDGSVAKNSVGASYIIMDQMESIIAMEKIKLPDYANIYEAELIAILEALKRILLYNDNTTFAIYSDSLSSLKAIENPYNNNPIVHKIKKSNKNNP